MGQKGHAGLFLSFNIVLGPHDGLVMMQFFVFAQVVLGHRGLVYSCTVGIFTVVVVTVGQRNERTGPRFCFCLKRGSGLCFMRG